MSRKTYYAHIDKAEPARGKEFYLEFHCLDSNFVDDKTSWNQKAIHNSVLENDDQVIILNNAVDNVMRLFGNDNFAEWESDWVVLSTNKEANGLLAYLYIENNQEYARIFIDKLERIPPNSPAGLFLTDNISLKDFPDANPEKIKMEIMSAGLRDRKPEFVSVYNVGQGNCNAICEQSSVPLLYFDLGGGCYGNRHTYKLPLKFCFSFDPLIILSHWDTDHYQSAKLEPLYKEKRWLLPRQKIGPVHLKFFLSLPSSKMLWPDYLPFLNFHWGTIIKCTGPGSRKNHSGLAISTTLPSLQNSITEVLLPADAAYTFIPGIGSFSFDGLVATHHGAEFDLNNSPVPSPKKRRAIVYSFGRKNSYKHPRRQATLAHRNNGWKRVAKKTTCGHIALSDSKVNINNCNGNGCSLSIQQKY